MTRAHLPRSDKGIMKREKSRSSRGESKRKANGTKIEPKLNKEGTEAEAREEGMRIKRGGTKGKKGYGLNQKGKKKKGVEKIGN